MFAIILGCLLLVIFTLTTPLQPIPPSLLHASSLNSTGATALAALNVFQCFDPSFPPPPGPLYPITYSGCVAAADQMPANVRADVPSIFSRDESADIQLPWRGRSGDCVMTLNVLNAGDEDIVCVQDARELASALCRICVGGYYRYGGRTPVGPRGVVYISVHGTTPGAVDATGPAAPQASDADARQIEPRGPDLLNTSSLAPAGISLANTANADSGECFSDTGPSARRHLWPVKSLDCLNAADEMLNNRPAHVLMTFGRRAGMDFKLPWTARNKSCIVTVDTLNDVDFDEMELWEVLQTALNRIDECTTGDNIFGGRKAFGSKDVVYVYVFGIGSPLPISAPAFPAPAHVVARAQIENSDLSLLNASSSQSTERLNLTSASALRGIPECFDPPLPRERAVPISDFADCAAATVDIVASRTRTQIYTFSRKPSADPYHYQLPATFKVGTCAVHLDMAYEDDEDAVRLAFVESSAWVLAHKCSGLEKTEEKWGGMVTVSVGATDLIKVWVYGVVPQSAEGSSPSRVASLLESE